MNKTGHQSSQNRRKTLRIFAISAALLFLMAVMIAVVPSYVARWVIRHELKKMDVQVDGIQTLTVDLWNSEIVFGPVEFWAAEGRHGQIGYAGFGYDLTNLFKQKALIEHFLIKGVDIYINRLRDGSITINGLGIDQFFAESSKSSDADTGKSWGVGSNIFQVLESRFIFADYTGGTLTMDVDRLVLRDFQSWNSAAPGSFELEARINDIFYKWQGKAQVFAPTKTLSLTGTVEDATLAKIVEFTGPVGFIDPSGTFGSEGSHGLTLFPDHRIRIESNATLNVKDVDVEGKPGENLQMKTGMIHLQTRLMIEPQGKNYLEGSIAAAVDNFSLRTEDGTSLAVDTMKADFSELDISHQARGPVGLPGVFTKVDIKAGTGDDVALPLVQLLVIAIEKLAAQLADDMVSARGTLAVSLKGAEASMPGYKDIPAIKARINDWEAMFTRMEVDTTAPKVNVQGQIETTCTGITAEVVDLEGKTQLSAGRLHVALDKYRGEREKKTVSVDTSGSAKLEDLKVSILTPTGQSEIDLNLTDLKARYDALALHKTPEYTEAEGQLRLGVSGLDTKLGNILMLVAKEGAATLSKVHSRRESKSISVDVTGAVDLSHTKMAFPDENSENALDVTARAFRADFLEFKTNSEAGRTKLRGPIKAHASEMAINAPEGLKTLKLKAGALIASLPEFRTDFGEERSFMDIVGTANLEKVDVLIPDSQGRPQIDGAAASLDLSAKEFAARLGKQSQWRSTLEANAQKLSIGLNEGAAGTMRVKDLAAKGIKVDQSLAIALNELTLAGVDAHILDQSFKAFSGRDDKGGEAQAKAEHRLKFQLGRMTIAKGSAINYTDTAVEPQVQCQFAIEEFEVAGFDTADPDVHTEFKVKAGINKASRLTADGWAIPLNDPRDFDLTARVQRLHLPTFSPYIGKRVGYTADKGDLTADLAVKSSQNTLEGKVQVKIKDLGLKPVSSHRAEWVKEYTPLPIDTAVAALEDSEGVIALEFPITGTLGKPHIAYGQALEKAIESKVGSLLRKRSPVGSRDALSLHPIVFKPGSVELDPKDRAHLDQLADLLLQRPRLAVQVCGRATHEDFTALLANNDHQTAKLFSKDWWESLRGASARQRELVATEKRKPSKEQERHLADLAKERMRVVTHYLIKGKRIKAERIDECNATYSSDDTEQPRIQFFLQSSSNQ